MHHLDLGLFNYQVTFTRELLKELCGQVAVNELDNRLSSIPRFPGLKIFKNGLENIKRFTANEFINMMKVFLLVIEGIIKKHHKVETENINAIITILSTLLNTVLLIGTELTRINRYRITTIKINRQILRLIEPLSTSLTHLRILYCIFRTYLHTLNNWLTRLSVALPRLNNS